MKINLHTHSNKSLDGEYEVNELINILKDNDFDIISVTDHDTCDAYEQIKEIPGIKVITGIEADGIANNHTYDFLCYNYDLDEVKEYVKRKYETVAKRQRRIFNALVEKANMLNIKLNNIDSYDENKEYAHSAIFKMLDKDFLYKYNLNTPGDLYRLGSIDQNFPLYLDMHIVWPDVTEIIDLIHRNNGKVFLAHPYRYNRDVKEVLNDVKDYVDGIEICNNPKTPEEVEFLYNYAKEHNLLVSCGSDYNGNNRYSLECEYLTEEMIKDILKWIK